MLTCGSSDSDSDCSVLAINVSKSKRIGRLLRRDQGGDSDEEQTTPVTNATVLVEPYIPDLDNFLDPTMNEKLVVIGPNDHMEDMFFPIEPEAMSNSADILQDEKETANNKNKKRPEKRAPNSKKTLLEVKKMADTMVRSAPLAIDDAVSRAPISDFNMSGFLQRFQATTEKRLELEKEAKKRAAEEAAINKPLSKAQLKEKALADMAAQLRELNSKPASVLFPMINLAKKVAPIVKKPAKKVMTHLELNAFLKDTMASRSFKLKEALALEESAKEDFYNDIVLSTDEEDLGMQSEAEQSEAEAGEVHNTENVELAAEVQVPSETQVVESTGLLDGATMGLLNPTKTQLISNNHAAATFSATIDSLALSRDLTDATSNMRLLNITRQTIASNFYAENDDLNDSSLNPSDQATKFRNTEPENDRMDDDSDEEIVIRKVSRRQQPSDIDEEVEERPIHLKRLVKKDVLTTETPKSSKGPINSPTRNQFVADQADEEDDDGELIQYSGSEEESDEDEYDLDDLETGSDIGSVNQDAIRQLHQKYEKDAENKGYNRLTRRRQGANRILGDDDEGHQLARRQRNRLAAQPKYDEALDLDADNTAREEHLIADFIPTGVNKLNHLFLRIPRSKTEREKLSMHSKLTEAQVAQAWNDPNPQMAFFRASTSKTSSIKAPKKPKPLMDNFVNRAAHQHNLLNRSSSSSSRSGAATPTKATLPGFQNPLPTFLKGHPTSSMTIADPVERAAHVSQLKRQLDTKVPEGLITKLSTTNARRFGYGNFKVYGKRSDFPDLFPDARKKPETTVYKTPRY